MNLSQYFNQNQANAADLDIYKFVIDKINKIKPEDKNGKKYIVTVNGLKCSPSSSSTSDWVTIDISIVLKPELIDKNGGGI